MSHENATIRGKVYFVGAGPGAPGLITVRGVACLQKADVVLYDYLVNARILEYVREGAELICLGQHGRSRIWSQAEINARVIESAFSGRTVVRLKGGDPAVFARGAEETRALVERGIRYEIVPGITAALAAGSYAGVPLTHREYASAVALVTGQEISSKVSSSLDYELLARFPGTLVIYMGVTTVHSWTTALIQGGMSADTPAAIVRRCSFPNQQTIRCSVGELADLLGGPRKMRPPVVVVIGAAAAQHESLSWFEQLPLFGQQILVTRPAHQAAGLAHLLEEEGANVLVQPAIELREPDDWGPVDAVLSRLDDFDWLVFSSVNGVHAFLRRLETSGRDMRALGAVRLAAIGPATVEALQTYHLRVDRRPSRYQAEDLAQALIEEARGKRFLLARASRGREVLAEQLAAAGGEVTQVVVYRSVDVRTPDETVAGALRRGEIDWTTVTSSAIARSLVNLFAGDLAQTRLASISPLTSATLRQLGWEPVVEAREATMQGVADAILQYPLSE